MSQLGESPNPSVISTETLSQEEWLQSLHRFTSQRGRSGSFQRSEELHLEKKLLRRGLRGRQRAQRQRKGRRRGPGGRSGPQDPTADPFKQTDKRSVVVCLILDR